MLVEVDTNIILVYVVFAITQDCVARSIELSTWKVRLAMGLRILAGGGYLDAATIIGVSYSTVNKHTNNTPAIDRFFISAGRGRVPNVRCGVQGAVTPMCHNRV